MASCKLKQNANEGCNSCASLTGLVLCFIACFILLVIIPLPADSGAFTFARREFLSSRHARAPDDSRRLPTGTERRCRVERDPNRNRSRSALGVDSINHFSPRHGTVRPCEAGHGVVRGSLIQRPQLTVVVLLSSIISTFHPTIYMMYTVRHHHHQHLFAL